MLLKLNTWLIIAVISAAFYASVLLYDSGSLREVTQTGWAHFHGGEPGDSSIAQSESKPTSIPSHPHAPPPEDAIASKYDYAIATFLTGQASDDTYFDSTRLLAYQLLHAKETRIRNHKITFVVLCGTKLEEDKKQALRDLGATVITLQDVLLPSWIKVSEARWSEQFTKLRVFERTEFKRILYIDADYMIMSRMDAIFDEAELKDLSPTLFVRDWEIHEDEGPLPPKWLFAARSENGGIGGFEHDVPPLQTSYANAGFFMIAPDKDMYAHFMTVMACENRFRTTYMEQDMLNYIFRRDGPMPWRELDWTWSANFVNEKDVAAGVHSLHGKFWAEGPKEVRERWAKDMEEMGRWEKERREKSAKARRWWR